MSNKTNYISNNLYIGKNDTLNQQYLRYDINSLLNETYSPINYWGVLKIKMLINNNLTI